MYDRLVRWAFARFYREFAWTYDTVAALVSGNQWHAWALAALPYLRGRVLELGCGTGYLQRELAGQERAPRPIGLDASPQMLALARRKIARAGLTALLVRADARRLPFPSATFDTIVATFPSEYIIAAATLDEARRVLRPGGRIVIVLAAQFTGAGIYERLVDLAYRITLQPSPRFTPSSTAALERAPTFTQASAEALGLDPAWRPAGESALASALARAGFTVYDMWQPAVGSRAYLLAGLAA